MSETNVVGSSVLIQCITPDAERVVMRAARQSSANPESDDIRLIDYLVKNQHWSPFELAHLNVYIVTSRAIARQLLRHRSFAFQEFSQRYQNVGDAPIRWEARMEHTRNRQSSVELDDTSVLHALFGELQDRVWETCTDAYRSALQMGIAREQARALLPEGLCPTKMCMSGSLRSWIHYIQLRTQPDTQKEHRQIAEAVRSIFASQCPYIAKALGWVDATI